MRMNNEREYIQMVEMKMEMNVIPISLTNHWQCRICKIIHQFRCNETLKKASNLKLRNYATEQWIAHTKDKV